MIFVTVGAQMSFDRLIRAVDEWAAQQARTDVFAQIGPTDFRPKCLEWSHFLDPDLFRQHVAAADIVIAHAGMGSIITALELGKPILVMPRRGHLNETRNDHQVDTARQFLAQGRIAVAYDENELIVRLNGMQALLQRPVTPVAPATASPELIRALRAFIHSKNISAGSDLHNTTKQAECPES